MTYRDHFPCCPRCRTELETAGSASGCRACGGRWISEGVVTSMVHEMHDSLETANLQFTPRTTGDPLACPACDKPMAQVDLEGVAVDRCEPHGIWFDGVELQRALVASSERKPRAEGTRADLRAPLINPVRSDVSVGDTIWFGGRLLGLLVDLLT